MTRPVDVSVIVPHLNQHTRLARCLSSLARQEGACGRMEVIVVDNGSVEPPAPIVAAFPFGSLAIEREPGPGPARNRGVALARGPILAFIDSDCTAHPGWIAAIERAFDADPRAAILGGDVRIPREAPRTTQLEAYESVFAYRMKEYIARQNFTGTGNLATRRTVMDRVGPFAGIGVAEDRDWGRRATALGYRVRYLPEMIVYHPARASFAELALKWDRHVAHDFAESGEGGLDRARWLGRAAAVALSPPLTLPRILASDRVSGLRERALAFACLARIRAHRARRMVEMLGTTRVGRPVRSWNRG